MAQPTPTFEETYDAQFDFVWRSLRALGLEGPALEDAVQDVFLIVHRKLHGFEARSALVTWLYGIVRHVAFNHRRRRGRKDGALAAISVELPDPEPGPDQRVADREALRFVQSFLDKLDRRHREVFVLCELEQLSAPEVARLLGTKPNTVYSRLRVAREAFQVALMEHQEPRP